MAACLHILLVVSPDSGIIENWLPVLAEIKVKLRDGCKITYLFPEGHTVDHLDLADAAVQTSAAFLEGVLFKASSGFWLKKNNFEEAKVAQSRSIIKKAFLKLFHYPVIQRILSLIRIKESVIATVFPRHHREKIVIEEEINKFDVILYDVKDETKQSIVKLLDLCQNASFFSLCHGIAVGWQISANYEYKSFFSGNRSNLLVYLFSKIEIPYYQQLLPWLKRSDIKVIGVPRHDARWINKVRASTVKIFPDDKYVLVFSKQSMAAKSKYNVYRWIHQVFVVEQNMKIVIRCHPKEVSLDSIYRVLGRENKGTTWGFSSQNPLVLNKNAIVTVTFVSTVCYDMARTGVPTIELTDPVGDPYRDKADALRDANDLPASVFEENGLVLAAKSLKNLRSQYMRVSNKRDEVVQEQSMAYKSLIPTQAYHAPALVADDIIASRSI